MPSINPTREDILQAASQNDYLGIIKAYRTKTGKGLRDSKEAIDACVTSENLLTYVKTFNTNKLLEAFGFSTNRDSLLEAITCALDNYKTLGFATELDAVQMVVNNFFHKDD